MAKKDDALITNRHALRDFHVEKTFEAGIQLFGNEVKSLRAGSGNLKGSFARIDGKEIFLFNMHISPYEYSREEIDPLRKRKLLLHKNEIKLLDVRMSQRGYALIPLKVYFKGGYAKVELGLAKGKKLWDKRAAIKEKQIRKETEREIKRRAR